MNTEVSQEILELDLDRIPGMRPAEKAIIVDLFGWNNRDRKRPPESTKALMGFEEPGFIGLLLRSALQIIMGDSNPNLGLLGNQGMALLKMIMGLDFNVSADSWYTTDLKYRPPERLHPLAVDVVSFLLAWRLEFLEQSAGSNS